MTTSKRHIDRQTARSAAKPADAPGDRLRDRLNNATPQATRCAWPGCGKRLQVTIKGHHLEHRFGILCFDHAADVASAVVESQVATQRFAENLAKMDSERMAWAQAGAEIQAQYDAELAARRQGREGFVYYIQVDERIKVGFSTDVKRRMRAYPPASKLLAVEPGDRDLEKQRHRQFKGSLAYGREWFTPTQDLRDHIDALLSEHGAPPRHMAHHYTAKRQPMRVSRRP
jgi:hypothetical protein